MSEVLEEELIKQEGFKEGGLPYSDVGGTITIGFGYTKYSLDGKDGRPHWNEYWSEDGTPTGKTMSKAEAKELLPLVVVSLPTSLRIPKSFQILFLLCQLPCLESNIVKGGSINLSRKIVFFSISLPNKSLSCAVSLVIKDNHSIYCSGNDPAITFPKQSFFGYRLFIYIVFFYSVMNCRS